MIIIIKGQEPLTNQTELSFADLSRAPSSAMFSLSSTWSFKIKINYFFFNFKSSTWPGFLFPTISSFCISPVQATPATLSSKILLEISPSRWFAWGLRPAAHIWQNFGLIGKSWTIGHISLYQNLFSKHLRSCVVNLEGNLTSAAWLASQSGGYLIQNVFRIIILSRSMITTMTWSHTMEEGELPPVPVSGRPLSPPPYQTCTHIYVFTCVCVFLLIRWKVDLYNDPPLVSRW